MSRRLREALYAFSVALIAISFSACASKLEGERFTSSRFSYSIIVPKGWVVEEAGGKWLKFQGVDPSFPLGIDIFYPSQEPRDSVGVAARSIEAEDALSLRGIAEEKFVTSFHEAFCLMDRPELTEEQDINIGKEQGIIISVVCPQFSENPALNFYALWALVFHEGKLYWFTWKSLDSTDPEGDKAQFRQMLNSVEFTN